MPTNDQLLEWDRQYYWHAFTQMDGYEPLVIERAEGCWLIDIDGKRILDGVSSLWCNLHGHRHPRIDAAIIQQLGRVAHSTSLGQSNPAGIQLAKRLVDLAPDNLRHVFFSCDGSSAVEVALKMAFQYWRQCSQPQADKNKFIALADAYHGDTIGSTSLGGIPLFHALFGALLFDVVRLPIPDSCARPEGISAESACQDYLDELESVLRARHEEIAAVVVEPLVQGAAGMILHPRGYLRGVRQLTEQYGVLLIADEIVTAFGRTGRMFACEHEQVTPDLMCLGKGLTGGYLPMSATLATDKIFQAFLGTAADGVTPKTFFHGHTYGGNPLAAAAALASLDLLEEERVLERLPAKCDQLAGILERCRQLPQVGAIRQLGMLAAVDLFDRPEQGPFDSGGKPEPSRIETSPAMAQQACRKALELGLWLRPLGGTLIIVPPLSITERELTFLGDGLLQSIGSCAAC
jgi:adenosylmethionine---8-amino-7-oxononanoate aminotransferase